VSFEVGPAEDFGPHRRAVSVDAAKTAGLVVADMTRSEAVTKYRSRKTGAYYELDIQHAAVPRGGEWRAATRAWDRPWSGPMSILIEAQYIGVNPRSSASIIESRTRWAYAFEAAGPGDIHGRTSDPGIILISPPCWQAGWLGLASSAGREALKIASDLSAETAVKRMGLSGPIVGDEADAFNMLLWWLDHHLAGMPRRFSTAAERAAK